MRKRDRQQLIETLIKQKRLSTQQQLVAALKRHGYDVTQATVSRDMRELGVQKGSGKNGGVRYVIPPPAVLRDPADVLARVLANSAASVRQAQNLVVVRSEPGTAPTVGRAIDELEREEVVGTVAGDDTVLMVLTTNTQARTIAKYFNDLIEGREQT
ncbi:MAG: arginine repressor [Thermoleophilia bacterium]